jgi:hypothetical protein
MLGMVVLQDSHVRDVEKDIEHVAGRVGIGYVEAHNVPLLQHLGRTSVNWLKIKVLTLLRLTQSIQ